MKEIDALKKWCPMVRSGQAGCNRAVDWPDNTELNKCIASNCMMWESYEYYSDGKGGGWSQQNADETLNKVTDGDCGLKTKELVGM